MNAPPELGSFGPFPHEELIAKVIASGPPRNWRPSGLTRELYLDIAERIVRAASTWQSEDGRILDPYEGVESPTTTSRYVGAAGSLIGAGRCGDLLSTVIRSFDWCARTMAESQGAHPPLQSADFFTKELAWAFRFLSDLVPADVRARWRAWLESCTPEGTYTDLVRESNPSVSNWNVYALVGVNGDDKLTQGWRK